MTDPTYFPELRRSSDQLLDELDESIPQGVPNSTRFDSSTPTVSGRRATDVVDTDFADLDLLLAESVAKVELDAQYKRDREARRKGYAGMSKEEVDFCNSRMHAFEMAREWDADYALAVFDQVECEHCGAVRHVFSRLMEHHQHRHVKTTQRWVTVSSTKVASRPVMNAKYTPMCMDCIDQFGYDGDIMQWDWLDDIIRPGEEDDAD